MIFKNNPVIAAPMAGISDTVFRTICKEQGADIVYSEMISVEGIIYGSDATMDLMAFDIGERPLGIQLFGSDPEHFARVAPIVVERFNPDFIDLNAGCPVQKVVKNNGGSALLKNLDNFELIIRALVHATTTPVTVKLRSGWQQHEWIDCAFAQCAEVAGACAVTLHPRSRSMGFSGHSYWDRIAAVKQAVAIPVIGNGDILSVDDALAMKSQTGCDGIMIGRGSYGNPWIFSQIKAAFAGKPILQPSQNDRYSMASNHTKRYREKFGEQRAFREMKRHIAWYIKGCEGAAVFRDRIFRATSTGELEQVLAVAFFR